jgi:hypothetical protein
MLPPEFNDLLLRCRVVAGSVTRDFQSISHNVRTIEAALRESNAGSTADLLRHVQEGEKQKLNLTVTLQVNPLEFFYQERSFFGYSSDWSFCKELLVGWPARTVVPTCPV